MEQKINLSINDGESFFAHQTSVNYNPTMVFFDFKNLSPRIDERSRQSPTFALKHNVVMMDPYQAVLFKDIITKAIKEYEKQFGKIEEPKALKKVDKKGKKQAKEDVPHYFG